MAGSQESNASLFSDQTPSQESSQAKRSQNYEEETFYKNCRAAYLAVFKSSLENIKSKEQLCLVLQQAGRNPSQKTVNKYWTLQTTTLNFDDFCFILKQEEPVRKTELLKAFAKIDVNNEGCILHSELHKLLTTRGEKMTLDEINAITELVEVNSDGKFDYYKEWQHTQSKGCFFLEENGEIISHKYKLFLSQRSTVCITINPVNLHEMEGKPSPWLVVDTALYILKENEAEENIQLVGFTELRNKEVFGWRGELEGGVYWIIPFTTGCRFRKSKKQIRREAKLVHGDGEVTATKEFRAALSEIFEMIDLDGNGFLSLEENNFFEMRTSGEKCDEEAWAICKENFDMKNNELTRQGFMDLNLMEACQQGRDLSSFWMTLQSMGYNKALELTEACPFSIHVYAEKCKPRIQPVCLEAGGEQLKTAICMSVANKGDAKPMDASENIVIHTYKSDTRITSVIENKSESKTVIHLNNEQSRNCVSNRGLNTFAIEVASNSMMVCQHVMPQNEQEEWIYSCVYSILP
ncbi:EF-hand calcium-binding domain-containing protein 7 isoform X3 [Zootoca vivipara]|uniref:EF-hand calcium-binding domain-containing protein 7 isoform X3 n=1 Tax=Zootoca vivipara TaxID=8524 RepID=UPI00293BFDFA|nr:EF-hand calcium-binding domain-containing protein 7 isoform X3 [Zootoca vivipara]